MNAPRDPRADAAHGRDAMKSRTRDARDPGDALDDAALAQVRNALDAGVAALDDATRRRLAEARRVAVARARTTPRWHGLAWPAVALAASLALWLGTQSAPAPLPAPAPTADVSEYAKVLAVATEDDAVPLEEDLEFYAWLDAQAQDG